MLRANDGQTVGTDELQSCSLSIPLARPLTVCITLRVLWLYSVVYIYTVRCVLCIYMITADNCCMEALRTCGRSLDLQLTVCGFNSQPVRFHVTVVT